MASVEEAKRLLDKALSDEGRVERVNEGSGAYPLYLSTTRWDFVRQARRLLEEAESHEQRPAPPVGTD